MKVLVGVLLAVALAAPAADAGVFGIFHRHKSQKAYDGSDKKLPRPMDSPIVRPKLREDHKLGKRAGRHPQQSLVVTSAASRA